MLDGKMAVVTGGSNGIGRAIATTYAEYGADVVIADRKREPRHADEPVDRVVESEGQRGLFVETDVSDPDDVSELFEVVDDEFGSLDVLVNNAGISAMDAGVLEIDESDWELILSVNLTGTFLGCKFGLPLLLDGGGAIVNTSSTAGLRATAGRAAYCASKGGVTNLTRQLALDFGGRGVRTNSIHPAPIETRGLQAVRASDDVDQVDRIVDGVPMGRIGQPEDVAGAAAFLASDLASYVNGHSLVVDGGLMTKYY